MLPIFADQLVVSHQRSITVKQSLDAESRTIGIAYSGLMYPIVTKKVGYYLIQLPDGRLGWVQTKAAYIRVKEKEGNLIVVDEYIPVYDELSLEGEVIETIKEGNSFPIREKSYSYFKIRLPEGIEGWIYAGKPTSPWVSLIREEVSPFDENHYIADFSSSVIKSNMSEVTYNKINFLNSQACHQLFEPFESEIQLEFKLKDVQPKYIELVHAIKSNQTVSFDNVTTITVFVNTVPIVKDLQVTGVQFLPIYLLVPTQLNQGSNTITIRVQGLSSPYLIKYIRVFNANLVDELKQIKI